MHGWGGSKTLCIQGMQWDKGQQAAAKTLWACGGERTWLVTRAAQTGRWPSGAASSTSLRCCLARPSREVACRWSLRVAGSKVQYMLQTLSNSELCLLLRCCAFEPEGPLASRQQVVACPGPRLTQQASHGRHQGLDQRDVDVQPLAVQRISQLRSSGQGRASQGWSSGVLRCCGSSSLQNTCSTGHGLPACCCIDPHTAAQTAAATHVFRLVRRALHGADAHVGGGDDDTGGRAVLDQRHLHGRPGSAEKNVG